MGRPSIYGFEQQVLSGGVGVVELPFVVPPGQTAPPIMRAEGACAQFAHRRQIDFRSRSVIVQRSRAEADWLWRFVFQFAPLPGQALPDWDWHMAFSDNTGKRGGDEMMIRHCATCDAEHGTAHDRSLFNPHGYPPHLHTPEGEAALLADQHLGSTAAGAVCRAQAAMGFPPIPVPGAAHQPARHLCGWCLAVFELAQPAQPAHAAAPDPDGGASAG